VAPFAQIEARPEGKPVLASFMGGASIARAEEILRASGIPAFPFPDTAARAFAYM
jgi:acetyltransferase